MRRKTKQWPKNGQPANFEDLVSPIVKAIRFAYKMTRQNVFVDVPWTGFEIGENERATCLLAQHQLSAENLKHSNDDQGRDALEEIIGLAVRLGIEQGRRIFRSNDSDYKLLQTRLKLQELEIESLKYQLVKKGGK